MTMKMGHADSILTERPIGVIIPPPDIKKVIDKAATFVGKYGSNFEAMLKQEAHNLPKFSFLNEGDPYRPYYDSIVASIAKGLMAGK